MDFLSFVVIAAGCAAAVSALLGLVIQIMGARKALQRARVKKYVCVAGASGAGKETLYLFLKEELERRGYTTSIHHFSDPLNETLAEWIIPNCRPNQQTLSTFMRTARWLNEESEPLGPEWSQEIMSRAIRTRALADTANFVFLDGVRRPSDLVMLRTLPNSTLVGIIRDDRLRYEGLKKRADRPGDAEKTWEQFLLEQQAEPEQEIGRLVAQADIQVANDSTKEEIGRKAIELAGRLVSS